MYGHRQLHTGSGISKCEYCGKEFTVRRPMKFLIHSLLNYFVVTEKRQLQRAPTDPQRPSPQVPSLSKGVCPAVQSCSPHQNPHWRKTLPVHLLRKEVFRQGCVQLSHPSAHQGRNVQLPVLWPNLFQKAG